MANTETPHIQNNINDKMQSDVPSLTTRSLSSRTARSSGGRGSGEIRTGDRNRAKGSVHLSLELASQRTERIERGVENQHVRININGGKVPNDLSSITRGRNQKNAFLNEFSPITRNSLTDQREEDWNPLDTVNGMRRRPMREEKVDFDTSSEMAVMRRIKGEEENRRMTVSKMPRVEDSEAAKTSEQSRRRRNLNEKSIWKHRKSKRCKSRTLLSRGEIGEREVVEEITTRLRGNKENLQMIQRMMEPSERDSLYNHFRRKDVDSGQKIQMNVKNSRQKKQEKLVDRNNYTWEEDKGQASLIYGA